MDLYQANLQPNLSLFNSRLPFNPTPTFLGVTFDRLSFLLLNTYLRSRPSFSLVSRPYAVSLLPNEAPLRIPSLFCIKLFFGSFAYASPGWFPFLSAIKITKLERLHRAANRAISGSLSSSPIPVLLSEAFLPPLRGTPTHFALSSYEPALRFPTSFPISGLTRLGVKPRLCRSFWRAFASTHTIHASFYYHLGGSSCLPSVSPLEFAFLHCGLHPFLSMLPP